jgi:hypothetical protein
LNGFVSSYSAGDAKHNAPTLPGPTRSGRSTGARISRIRCSRLRVHSERGAAAPLHHLEVNVLSDQGFQ